ncbi:ATP-binding protein [Burkholderia territorii]|uniref:ATP-binding protein n=1 Tax=Burkholderia territorii TaxID=1503055 RepID=UPI0012D86F1E|nr:ATP-binding protein [Burkholderia territorii]
MLPSLRCGLAAWLKADATRVETAAANPDSSKRHAAARAPPPCPRPTSPLQNLQIRRHPASLLCVAPSADRQADKGGAAQHLRLSMAIWQGLSKNAANHATPDGNFTVRAKRGADGTTLVHGRDNGAGAPPARPSRVGSDRLTACGVLQGCIEGNPDEIFAR